MSFESAQAMYDAQEPCINCNSAPARRWDGCCSKSCSDAYRDMETEDDVPDLDDE